MSRQQELRIAELERVLENILCLVDSGCVETDEGDLIALSTPLQESIEQATDVLYDDAEERLDAET